MRYLCAWSRIRGQERVVAEQIGTNAEDAARGFVAMLVEVGGYVPSPDYWFMVAVASNARQGALLWVRYESGKVHTHAA